MNRRTEAAIYVSLIGAGRAIALLFPVTLALSLPRDEFGTYAFVVQSASVASALSLLGNSTILTVALTSQGSATEQFRTICKFIPSLAASTAAAIALSTAVWWLYLDEHSPLWLSLLIAATLALSGSSIINGLFSAVRKPLTGAFAALICSLLPFGVWLVLPQASSVYAYLAFTSNPLAYSTLGCALVIFILLRRAAADESADTGAQETNSRRINIGFLLSTVTSLSASWIIQESLFRRSGSGEYADYAVATQFFTICTLLPTLVAPYLTARYASISNLTIQRRLRDRLFAIAALLSACGAGTGAAIFLLLERSIPEPYIGARLDILLALTAGAIQLAKAPLSIYFLSRLNTRPDVIGGSLSLAISISLVLFSSNDSAIAGIARLITCIVGAAVAIAFAYGPLRQKDSKAISNEN